MAVWIPFWSRDGKLFYTKGPPIGTRQLMAVDTRIQPTFVNGKTTPLPIEGLVSTGPHNYDIMPDGKFIVVVAASSTGRKAPTAQFSVTLNWFEELKRKVPLKRVCTHCAGSLARSVMGFDNFRSSAVRQF